MPSAARVTVTALPPPRHLAGPVPVDIEELLRWTYARQKAHLICGQGRGLEAQEAALDGVAPRFAGSSAATVERVLRLGCIVDQSGPDAGHLHPDAEAVHRAVELLDSRHRGLALADLLIGYARTCDRPDAMVGAMPRPQPVLNWRGRIQVEWTDAGRRCGHCPIVYEPSAARILEARLEYARWHRGLRLLALALQRARLAAWYPLAPAAPVAPWETSTER